MQSIKRLLLLATVLSFAAMSDAGAPDDAGPSGSADAPVFETCQKYVPPTYDRAKALCNACCKLKGWWEFKQNWIRDDEEFEKKRCICKPHDRHDPNYRLDDKSIEVYSSLIFGSVDNPATNPDIDPEDDD
jgi:hypothetical protein